MLRATLLLCLVLFVSTPAWSTCASLESSSDAEFRKLLDGGPVFLGTVTGHEPPPSPGGQVLSVEVDRKWALDTPDHVRVLYLGTEFEVPRVGSQILFITRWDTRRQMLVTYECTLAGTGHPAFRQRLINLLGEGAEVKRKSPAMETDGMWSGFPPLPLIVMVIFAIFTLLTFVTVKRRTSRSQSPSMFEQ